MTFSSLAGSETLSFTADRDYVIAGYVSSVSTSVSFDQNKTFNGITAPVATSVETEFLLAYQPGFQVNFDFLTGQKIFCNFSSSGGYAQLFLEPKSAEISAG